MAQNKSSASHQRIEDEFYKVMKSFSNNSEWKEFARSRTRGLNLTEYQIDDIRADYIHDVKEQKYQMLSLWQRRNGRKATPENLHKLVDSFRSYLSQPPEQNTNSREPEPATHDVGHRNPTHSGNSVCDSMRRHPSQSGANNIEPMDIDQESLRSIPIHGEASMPHAFSSLQDSNQQTFTEPGQPPANQSGNQNCVHLNQGTPSFTASMQVNSSSNTPGRSASSFEMESSAPNNSSSSRNRDNPDLTNPKELGTSTTNRIRTTEYETIENKASPIPNLTKQLQGLGGFMNNVQINVVGKNAVGIQTNYYFGGKKVETKRPKKPVLPETAEYCAAVGEIDIKPADDEDYDQHLEQQNIIYKISHRPKGTVLILNNSFQGQPDERHGSDLDRRNMELLWDKLGCKVFSRTDITAAESIQTFRNFVKSPAACSSDFVAVVIMSHGDQLNGDDVFYGFDRAPVKVKDVLEIFNNKNAARLQGIPKLFFFQFCRGGNVDMGSEHMERVDIPAENLFNSLEATVRQSSGVPPSGDASDSHGIQTSKQPTMSDTMVSFATQAGFKAFRHQRDGSWYINAIINVFMRHSHDQHLVELMTIVNNAVSSKTAINTEDRSVHEGKEMSDFTSTLKKKLFFFPGFPKDIEAEFI
uniref:uncharacterized protein LOC120328466 n=1 Tax=Styela clava TaxID=7725 RepID=UPI0019396D72|nr:uncharacterized protein LOC120328466 [Styela clava]